MILQEPVQAAIWHCLNYYDYQNAIFLAERLCAEVGSEESIFLLSTCYYRSGDLNQAFWLLKAQGVVTPQARYLLAKCAYDLKQFNDAETALITDDTVTQKTFDSISKEFGELASFALTLLSKVYYKTEREGLANDANKHALQLNPFLWSSFTDLCNHNEKPDPESIFKIKNVEVFLTSQGTNLNSMVFYDTPTDQSQMLKNILNDYTSAATTTPSNADMITTPNNNVFRAGYGVGGLGNGGNLITDDTPISNNDGAVHADDSNLINNSGSGGVTPYNRKQFKYLSRISPSTPSFGILPIHSPNNDSSLIFSPTSQIQQQQHPQDQQQQHTLALNNEQKSISKKLKGNVGSILNRKEAPLQQAKPIFSQTGNITPRTPNSNTFTGQNVRRSSRLFTSNNYSVKENNKSPIINKFATPRSPPRKSKQRSKMNLNNSSLNDVINEKQQQNQQQKIETITSSADSKVLLNNCINDVQNMQQQLLDMKKESAEGLMSLLRDLGRGYQLLSQYDCEEAIEIFNSLPLHHHNSSWVQSMIALAHYEQRDYNTASHIFQEIHEREPNRLAYMDIYSTTLWHLQKEVVLSALAQDFIAQNKTSPITWCIVGNCFSLQKEHENAIKFFQRAVQVDPDFPYSYTLLGHELVLTEELDKAMSCFRTAILKDPRHYNSWFGIGTILSKQERYQLAEIHYRRALKINPKNSVILVHIGAMQYLLQKSDQALQTLNKAIKLDPKNPLCKFHRGSIFLSMGKHQLALSELEELKQIVPKESVVYYLIGKIHKKLGNVDLALMNFSWASDLDPKGANNQIKDAFDSNSSHTNQIDVSKQEGGVGAMESSDESIIVDNSYNTDSE